VREQRGDRVEFVALDRAGCAAAVAVLA